MWTQILHLITRVTATSAIISRSCAKGLPDDLPELRGQSSECSSDPMIILDTNMRSGAPDAAVVDLLDRSRQSLTGLRASHCSKRISVSNCRHRCVRTSEQLLALCIRAQFLRVPRKWIQIRRSASVPPAHFYQPGAMSNRRICPKPAGAAPKFDTYNRPSGPNVIPVGTNSPVTTSSISPDLLTRTTLPANGEGPGPAASDSSRTYSKPSHLQKENRNQR
jgi:hypothetical protein